ncbi:MAG: branched-chain amino acid ABC transporter substrate-binding protein [Anaerolineae bacterium]|nr:branched-chain amino acid ABC transporter substrate-binding protein [Anaerolineae bacterium]
MSKRLIVLLATLFVASLLLAACGGGATEAVVEKPAETMDPEMVMPEEAMGDVVVIAPGDPVRIGVSVALTGPIPEFGLDIQQSYELAIVDLNAAGGVLGHDYELDIQDGACDGDAATIVANGFAADLTIVAVAGGTCTGETLGLKPILQEARIPFVSASATNPKITNADCDICNRVALSDKLQADVDADYIYNTLGLTQAAVMHDNSDYGLGLAELFESAFKALGGTVLGELNGIQVGDTDFRAALTLVGTDSPEFIFFGGYVTEGGLIAAQMKEVGMEDVVFFSDDGVYGQPFIDAAGAAAENAYASFVAGDEIAEVNAEFDAKYEAAYGTTPDAQGPFHAQAYDSVNMIAAAIASVAVEDADGNLVIDREALIKAIRTTSGLQGLTGVLTCNDIGDCGAGGIQIFQVQGGAFIQVSGFGLD